MVRGNDEVANYWFPRKVLDFGEDHVMNITEATRAYYKKDAEVVLLFNPAPSQVVEIIPKAYEPFNQLEERCYPKAYPWPCKHVWLIRGLRGVGAGGKSMPPSCGVKPDNHGLSMALPMLGFFLRSGTVL